MIEPADEMMRAVWGHAPQLSEGTARAVAAAVLAVVARDRCMEASGHVYHPLARPIAQAPKPKRRDAPGCLCAARGRVYRLCPVHGKDARP